MLKSCLFTFCLLFSFSVCALEKADAPDARRLLAEKYLKVMPMQDMLDRMTRQFTRGLPPEKAGEMKRKMLEGVDIRALEAASVQAMVKTFTAGELEAMIDFYSSAEGRSAMDKMPLYMEQLAPLLTPRRASSDPAK